MIVSQSVANAQLNFDRLDGILKDLDKDNEAVKEAMERFNITEEDIENYGSHGDLEGKDVNPDNRYEVIAPSDYDGEFLDFSEFDFDMLLAAEWPPEAEYDYEFNIV